MTAMAKYSSKKSFITLSVSDIMPIKYFALP